MNPLLTPVSLGKLELPNRVVMAPLTRGRASEAHVAGPLIATYYAQRASAGLIVSEATAVDPLGMGPQPRPDSSWYFDIGIAPGYTFEKSGLKIEAPLRMLIPDSEFYGEYYASTETIALYEAGAKATIPMKFMPKGYGAWSFHAGFKYLAFVDENLRGMQQFNATGSSENHSTLLFCGLSAFF